MTEFKHSEVINRTGMFELRRYCFVEYESTRVIRTDDRLRVNIPHRDDTGSLLPGQVAHDLAASAPHHFYSMTFYDIDRLEIVMEGNEPPHVLEAFEARHYSPKYFIDGVIVEYKSSDWYRGSYILRNAQQDQGYTGVVLLRNGTMIGSHDGSEHAFEQGFRSYHPDKHRIIPSVRPPADAS